jgi:hypothetical protein
MSTVQNTAIQGNASPLDSILGSTLGSVASAGASLYGAQNAAEAQTTAENAGITTQQNTMGNINSLFSPQTTLGNNAFGATSNTLGLTGQPSAYSPYTTTGAGASTQLATMLGTNGQPANPQAFLSTPGYQAAVTQGTQAIQQGATANGNAYQPSTLANIGSYVTSTADQYYQNYLQNLQTAAGTGAQTTSALAGNQLAASGLGSTANQALNTANLTTGSNISQLQQNTGNAQASLYGTIGGTATSLFNGLSGSGALSGAVSGVGNLASGIFGTSGSTINGLPAADTPSYNYTPTATTQAQQTQEANDELNAYGAPAQAASNSSDLDDDDLFS